LLSGNQSIPDLILSRMRVLNTCRNHAIRELLRLRPIIQTSLLGSYMRNVPEEVQEESMLARQIVRDQ